MSKTQTLAYIRVSTVEQNTARQIEGMEAAKIHVDRYYTDKVSGRDVNRPQLQALLSNVREGDTVVVYSMDRLARNLTDLKKLVEDLTKQGVKVHFVKQNLTFTGEDSSMSRLLLNMLGAVSEFELELIKERQKEGVQLAKDAGKYKGRKPSLTPTSVDAIRVRLAAGERKAVIAREFKVSRQTLDTHLAKVAA